MPELVRRLVRYGSLAATLTLVAGGIIGIFGIKIIATDQNVVRAQVILPQRMVDLESAIGYGGMIHHFKNWVLRPDDDSYRVAAIASANRALGILDEIEQVNRSVDIEVSLEAEHRTIRDYLAAIDVATEMHGAGATAREIDAAVRIDDAAALADLQNLRASLYQTLEDRHRDLVTRLRLFVGLSVVMLVAAVVAFIFLMRARSRLAVVTAETRTGEMEQFTRIAAHDLMTPLRNIQSLATFVREDVAEAGLDLPEDARKYLGEIDTMAGRLATLVRTIFDYLRLGGVRGAYTSVDLASLVDSIRDLCVPAEGSLRREGDFSRIDAPSVELEIVLRNLVSNAVKHHPGSAPGIVVRRERRGKFHHFEVEDDGDGVAEADRERIFELFWSAKGGGNAASVSGIGLAVVARLVHGWGGRIEVRNANPRGAIFAFTLPVRDPIA